MLKLVGETLEAYEVEEYDNEDITIATIKRHLISKEDVKELFNVINRPLKFEELESGMWVWDSKYKEYVYICFVDKEYKTVKYDFSDTYRMEVQGYEENRLYRYKPLGSEGE